MMPFWQTAPNRGGTVPPLVIAVAAALTPSVASAQAENADTGKPVGGDRVRFDLEARERIEVNDHVALLPVDNDATAVAYHRLLVGARAKMGTVAGYLQLGSHSRSGGLGPASGIAVDRLDVQQAYLDLNVGDEDRGIRLRGGRAEMQFELVASRDAPNVRRAWDGARLTGKAGGWTADAFAAQVVRPERGIFDDQSAGSDSIMGLHLTSPKRSLGPFSLSAFLYRVVKPQYTIAAGTARSTTTTTGTVATGEFGAWSMSLGGAWQTGRFGRRVQAAFYGEGEVGRRFPALPGRPSVALRSSVFSGGAASARKVRTFDPLFPNFAYSTEAALQSPSNLIKMALIAEARPVERLTVGYRVEGLWRYSVQDAYYVPTGFALVPPDGSLRRWSGLQQQLRAVWTLSPTVELTGAFVRSDAGRVLRDNGRGNETFLMTQAVLRLN